MFYVKHNSDNFTMIDCSMPEENRDSIVEELKSNAKGKGIVRFISTHPEATHEPEPYLGFFKPVRFQFRVRGIIRLRTAKSLRLRQAQGRLSFAEALTKSKGRRTPAAEAAIHCGGAYGTAESRALPKRPLAAWLKPCTDTTSWKQQQTAGSSTPQDDWLGKSSCSARNDIGNERG